MVPAHQAIDPRVRLGRQHLTHRRRGGCKVCRTAGGVRAGGACGEHQRRRLAEHTQAVHDLAEHCPCHRPRGRRRGEGVQQQHRPQHAAGVGCRAGGREPTHRHVRRHGGQQAEQRLLHRRRLRRHGAMVRCHRRRGRKQLVQVEARAEDGLGQAGHVRGHHFQEPHVQPRALLRRQRRHLLRHAFTLLSLHRSRGLHSLRRQPAAHGEQRLHVGDMASQRCAQLEQRRTHGVDATRLTRQRLHLSHQPRETRQHQAEQVQRGGRHPRRGVEEATREHGLRQLEGQDTHQQAPGVARCARGGGIHSGHRGLGSRVGTALRSIRNPAHLAVRHCSRGERVRHA